MKSVKNAMLLYAVTDRKWLGGKTLAYQVEQALKGGATCIQLREKGMSEHDFLNEAVEIKKVCKKYGVPLIINDNAEIAVKSGADGVHVGQNDMNAKDVRKIIGENLILGVTARTPDEAKNAEQSGADYIGAGCVFTTSTKPDTKHISYDTLKEITHTVSIPVVAIGGVNAENIMELKGSGVCGAAVVSAVFSSEDIEAECRKLHNLSLKMTGENSESE